MSFVTTQPEALAAAAGKLQGLGSSMSAQNAAAAAPTTGVIPAAADEVSALQATIFAAYGTWYQQVSVRATAIHEMLVNTLGASAGSYGTTEAANQTATSSTSLSGLLGSLTGRSGSSSSSGILGALSSSTGSTGSTGGIDFGINGVQNFSSAASDFSELAQGQFVPTAAAGADAAGLVGVDAAALTGAVGPAGSAGFGGAPVLAGLGQASSVGGLSVPPSWAGVSAPEVSPGAATLAGTGWTTAAPASAPVTAMPAGMPAVASAGRGGLGFGAPRYGVKPTVMPKPAVV